jgi:hypothetical protein
VRLGKWSGAPRSWTVARSELEGEGIDSLVVLVQAGNVENPGPIFGAATMPLR